MVLVDDNKLILLKVNNKLSEVVDLFKLFSGLPTLKAFGARIGNKVVGSPIFYCTWRTLIYYNLTRNGASQWFLRVNRVYL